MSKRWKVTWKVVESYPGDNPCAAEPMVVSEGEAVKEGEREFLKLELQHLLSHYLPKYIGSRHRDYNINFEPIE